MSPSSSIDNELAEVADMFDSIRDHRVIVAAATLDELDRKPSDEVDIADVSVSVADTEHADNTHPYLMRYADMYAHSQEFSDPVEAGNTKFIKISKSTDPGDFTKGEVVIYHDKQTNTSYEATIIDVHYDERKQPHYDLMFKGGNNENNDEKEDTVRLSVKDDSIKQQTKALEAASETSSLKETNAVKCVNFDINPTQLFVAMYNGDWETALKRIDSHPEEASVWVTRYNTKPDDIKVFRWRLLPLHLCVALGGSNDDDDNVIDSDEAPAPSVPDDEKDELDHKENEKQPPPRTLLAALLKAYPQATQCTDDQNLIPLHSAIRGNASLAVIEDLLDADPTSVNAKDLRGRNAHILAKKVFGKRSGENKAREKKYARLKVLLHLAGTHPDAKLMEEQQQYESRLNKLENENLSLRRDNALLRSRCARNENLLEKLVQKLQEYQGKVDGDSSKGIQSHDQAKVEEILTSLLQEKEEELLPMDSVSPPPPSLPAIEDINAAENWKVAFDAKSCKNYYFNKKTRVVTWVKPKCLEENEDKPVDSEDIGEDKKDVDDEEKITENKVVGGRGAYAKRIERHIQTTMSYENSEDVLATPTSAKTGATEATTPETWEGRNRALELESFDEEDEDKANKPFMTDLRETSAGEMVQEISSSTIFRLSSHTESVPFDVDNSEVSFANAGAFSYADMVKVGDAEKESSEKNAHEQPKPKVTFKDVPAPVKKEKPVNPAISAEMERLRRKFSEES